MFEAAARNYWSWNCSVGGGSDTVKGKLHGIGCVLDESHVLTARHVWTQIRKDYSWPVVLKCDGLFRCEVAFESPEYDIAVLRATTQLHAAELRPPTSFPQLSPSPLMIGASVGFVSALHLHESFHETTRHTYFSSGSVGFFTPSTDGSAMSYVLSSCVVQKGMSGSPVFRPDGSLVGVFIQTISFRADFRDTSAPIYTLPVVSPIGPLRAQILAVLAK